MACVNPHAQWAAEVRVFDCRWIKGVEPVPIMTEDLNLVKFWIADVNMALVVDCQSGAIIRVGQINGPPEAARRT